MYSEAFLPLILQLCYTADAQIYLIWHSQFHITNYGM